MVLIDGVKWACEKCISGHRTSKCQHTTRPLTEIKPKGRPTTQCERCRTLRTTKGRHVKCKCIDGGTEAFPAASTSAAGAAAAGPSNALPPPAPRRSSSSPSSPAAPATFYPVLSIAKSLSASAGTSPNSQLAAFRARSANPVQVLPSNAGVIFTRPAAAPLTSLPLEESAVTASSCCGGSGVTEAALTTTTTPPSTLWVPSTHGTTSCFCGDACTCPGCPQHDPHGLKRPQEGEGEGIGCRCGEDWTSVERDCCASLARLSEGIIPGEAGLPPMILLDGTGMGTGGEGRELPSLRDMLEGRVTRLREVDGEEGRQGKKTKKGGCCGGGSLELGAVAPSAAQEMEVEEIVEGASSKKGGCCGGGTEQQGGVEAKPEEPTDKKGGCCGSGGRAVKEESGPLVGLVA